MFVVQFIYIFFFSSESKVSGAHVSKRIDDVHGLGWGNVKTGFVSKKKLGFLQREMSVDRESNTSSPVPNGKSRGLRVTFADSPVSPVSSRPESNLGWTDVRAQTPPLAGEWSSTQQTATTTNGSFMSQKTATASVQAKSFQQQQQQSSSSSFQSSQSSTFSSSVQKSSFSSSQSSSIQASKAFEAFPGLGVIENLKIE